MLVDTNIWSTMLRRNLPEDEVLRKNMRALIDEGKVAIIGPIRQEVLTGIKSEKQFELMQDYLTTFEDATITTEDYELAAKNANKLRSKGISTGNVDVLIVTFCQKHDIEVYSKDKDFDEMRKIIKFKKYQERKFS